MRLWLLSIIFALVFACFFGFGRPLLLAVENNAINAGFVSGLWYSQSPFFAGDKIRIYAAIQNRSGFDITGVAQFYNYDNLIGKADFSALNGRLIEVWMDWTAIEGKHSIRVVVVEPKKSEIGEPPTPINITSNTSSVNDVFVDFDTDGDKIGNNDDLDDDNDSVADTIELAQGTNPLSSDSDGDGIKDSSDPNPLDIARAENTENNLVKDLAIDKFIKIPKEINDVYESVKPKIGPMVDTSVDAVDEIINKLAKQVDKKRGELQQEIGDINLLQEVVALISPNKGSNEINSVIDSKQNIEQTDLNADKLFKLLFASILSLAGVILKYKIAVYIVLFLGVVVLLKIILYFIKLSRKSRVEH